MSESLLRGAAVGCGYFSQFHYEAWSRIGGVQLVACCDSDEAKVQTVPGDLQRYTDFRRMLDEVKPDFLDVITQPGQHEAICAEAIQRGIPVICQKPLGGSVKVAERMVRQAESAGVRLMVHENFRFQPWHRELKRQIDSGVIGSKLHSLSFRTRMGDGWAEDAYLARQPYFREYPRLLVYETGVHFIDTFRYLAGEISNVTAWLRRLNPVIAGEDCGLVVMEFANGVVGQWDANRFNEPASAASDPRYTFGECLIEGNEGSLLLDLEGRIMLKRLGEAEQEIAYAHERRGFAGDCVFAAQQHFADCLRSGADCETSGESYLRTMSIQEAVYASARMKQRITIA
jgi:D-apiose dehydrogenase